MSFRSSKVSRIYIGLLGVSAYARTGAGSSSTTMLEVTTLVDTSRVFIPGMHGATFSCGGPLDADAAANGQFDALTDLKALNDPTPISYLPLGVDGAAWLLDAFQMDFSNDTPVDGSLDWAMEAQCTGEIDQNGVALENNTTVTVDTDGTAVDNGAGTSDGAVFHLHVTAYSGLTSDDIIVEGSTTGAFAGEETTIATFAQVTGLTSERVEVAGTVPRHLRVVDDVTGTGSITRAVFVSRR